MLKAIYQIYQKDKVTLHVHAASVSSSPGVSSIIGTTQIKFLICLSKLI